MKAPIFPVFALKTVNDQVVIGGGGGNEHFGKKNGLVVIDETTYVDLDYLETEDVILGIAVYKPGLHEVDIKRDQLNWDSQDEREEERRNRYRSETNLSLSHLKKEDESGLSTCTEAEIAPKEVYLTCRGTNFFYLVKLASSKLTLIKRVEKAISVQFFCNSLLVIIENELYALLKVVDNPDRIDTLCTKKPMIDASLIDADHEEYVYYLYEKRDKLLVEREEGRTEIPEKWENFFIIGTKIHKVLKEEDMHVFVFKGQRYAYEKEIGDIYFNRDLLIFYLKGADSELIFLNRTATSYSIPKITCMNVEGDFTSVGTGDGVGYLFKGYVKISSRKLCDFAITGISYHKGMFYFSSFNGLVDRKHTKGPTKMILISLSILFLVLAILFGVFCKLLKS